MVPSNHKKVRLENLIRRMQKLKEKVNYQILQEDSFFVTVFLPSFFRKKEGPRRKGDERI
jgi:hypothetical protein